MEKEIHACSACAGDYEDPEGSNPCDDASEPGADGEEDEKGRATGTKFPLQGQARRESDRKGG
jgi:hypothetical protein